MWSRKQLALGIVAIVAVPIVLACLNPRWVFPTPGLDSWVYLGFFRHFPEYQGTLFPETYYGSRLSWVLPGYYVHKYLPPMTASYVLHLGVHVLAVLSLFEALRHTASPRAALAAALLLAGHAPFLESVGWDYVDGIGTAYYLLTIALLVRAAKSNFPRPWLFAAGVGAAAALYTNLTWVPLLGLLLPGYAMLHRRFHGTVLPSNVDTQLVMMFCGAATLTATLASVNHGVGGPWWFYRPSIEYAISSVGKANPWRMPGTKWLLTSYWLLWPTCAIFGSVVYLIRRQFRAAAESDALAFGWWPVNFLLLASLFAFETWRGQPFLQYRYYASYVFGPLMLAVGTLLALPLERLPRRAFGAVVGLLLVGAAFGLSRYARVSITFPLYCTFIGLVALALQPRSRWATLACLSLLTFGSALLPAPAGSRVGIDMDNRKLYARVTTAAQYIDEIKQSRQRETGTERMKIWFWYDGSEQLGGQHASLASVWLWGYSLINEQFPNWSQPPGWAFAPGDLVVVPSQRPDVVARALATGGDSKLKLRFLDSRIVGEDYHQMTLAVFVLEPRE